MEKKTSKKIYSNFLWRFAERCGAQIVTFIVSIILARILSPNDYGTVALVLVFITILQVFVDSGLGNALIQKKNVDNGDFSTVFFFNLFMCVILYLILWFLAPVISYIYDYRQLMTMTRILGVIIPISGVKNIQQAYVAKNLLYKKFFFATVGGTIVSAFIGVLLALNNYGAWAIVAQYICNNLIDTIILWIIVPWRPNLYFNLDKLKSLLRYGWKLLVSALLDTFYTNFRALIIGKKYSTSDLAYYNQAQKIPNIIVMNINSSIDSVLFPTMSQEQENRDQVRDMMRRAIKISAFFMAPIMVGIAVVSEPLIEVVLTSKWLECIQYIWVFCIIYLLYPLHTTNLNAMKALGRSDLFLKLEIIKKIIGISVLVITMKYGVKAILYGLLISDTLSLIVNTYPNKRLINYGLKEQVKDVIISIILALSMGIIIFPIKFIPIPNILILILQIICGIGIYYCISKHFNQESYRYCRTVVSELLGRDK